jgi:putative intracellular protease/amidase
VHVFVFDGMADWEAAFALAGIRNPEFQLHPGRYAVKTVGRSYASVVSMGGMRLLPDMTLDELVPADSAMLILPGGRAWESGGNARAVEKAARFIAEGVPVAAICAATLALARAGLLTGRQHTSNDAAYLAASRYRAGEFYRNVPAITDGNVITASGIAPIEFAYEVFKLLDLYEPQTLQAWYELYKHGDAARYCELAGAIAS